MLAEEDSVGCALVAGRSSTATAVSRARQGSGATHAQRHVFNSQDSLVTSQDPLRCLQRRPALITRHQRYQQVALSLPASPPPPTIIVPPPPTHRQAFFIHFIRHHDHQVHPQGNHTLPPPDTHLNCVYGLGLY